MCCHPLILNAWYTHDIHHVWQKQQILRSTPIPFLRYYIVSICIMYTLLVCFIILLFWRKENKVLQAKTRFATAILFVFIFEHENL